MNSNFVHRDGGLEGFFNTVGKGALTTLKSSAQGAAAGTAVAPGISTAIGAGAGEVFGVIKSLFGKHNHPLNQQAYAGAPDEKVTVFWDAEFNGKSRSFSPGEFVWLGKGGRYKISSVKIPPGLQLDVWKGVPHGVPNYRGHSLGPSSAGQYAVWTASKKYIGGGWNDTIDTIRVSRTRPKTTSAAISQTVTKAKKSGLLMPLAIGGGVLGIGGLLLAQTKKGNVMNSTYVHSGLDAWN
jgi:hypothetical protein